MSSLLPPNATTLERNVAIACADAEALPVPIRELHSPHSCPLALLPYLAWAYSVDEWDATWPEHRQRRAVADAIELHRRKGTVWAVKRTISNQGWILQELIEGAGGMRLNGACRLNGWHMLGSLSGWAMYRIVLSARNVTAAQKASLHRALLAVAPARCALIAIHYIANPLPINGTANLNGEYNLGAPYA